MSKLIVEVPDEMHRELKKTALFSRRTVKTMVTEILHAFLAGEAKGKGARETGLCGRWDDPRSAAAILAAGNRPPITPVEQARTAPGSIDSAEATAAVVERASASPCGPRPAFASPLFTNTARTAPEAAMRERDNLTGAAANTFVVNSPATVVPSSATRSARSGRPLGLRSAVMPAASKPRGNVTLTDTPPSAGGRTPRRAPS